MHDVTPTACLGWNEEEISVLGGPGMDSFEKTFLTALESLNPTDTSPNMQS